MFVCSLPVNMTLKNNIKYIKGFFSIGYFEINVDWKSDYLELLLSVQWHPLLMRDYTNFWPFTDVDFIPEFDFLPNCVRFPLNICNECGMPTEDAYYSGHLALSHFGTCICSNVETNLSWTCLVSDFRVSHIPRYFCFAFESSVKGRVITPNQDCCGGLLCATYVTPK